MKKYLLAVLVVLFIFFTLDRCSSSQRGTPPPSIDNVDSLISVQDLDKNYVANKNSRKLHSIHCDSLPYEQNRIYFSTVEEANKEGYTDTHKECMGY